MSNVIESCKEDIIIDNDPGTFTINVAVTADSSKNYTLAAKHTSKRSGHSKQYKDVVVTNGKVGIPDGYKLVFNKAKDDQSISMIFTLNKGWTFQSTPFVFTKVKGSKNDCYVPPGLSYSFPTNGDKSVAEIDITYIKSFLADMEICVEDDKQQPFTIDPRIRGKRG